MLNLYELYVDVYTNARRIRPVLEGSLLFLFIILFLLALSRQKLLSRAGLGEGGGHELTDVSSFCLDQLLYRWHIKKKKTEVINTFTHRGLQI